MITEEIIGRIVLKANITNETNLLIGSGEDDFFDFEILKEEGAPFIPGTSFAGLLSKFCKKYIKIDDTDQKTAMEYLWGSGDKYQSHLIVNELYFNKTNGSTYKFTYRDSVKINTEKGIGEKKYDYEILEPGACFCMYLELVLRKGVNVDLLKKIILFILNEGEVGKFKQGAFTSHDFGRLRFEIIGFHHFDFTKENDNTDVENWFKFLENGIFLNDYQEFKNTDISTLKLNSTETVTISGKFVIKNTLMIGYENEASFKADTGRTQLKNSHEENILSSKSIRGPIKHRALRIMNTINCTEEVENEIVKNLFGYVNETDKGKKKGKIIPKEINLGKNNFINDYIQNRIKICRLTSGTVEPALFNQQPLYNNSEPFEFIVEFEIEFEENSEKNNREQEIGLMMLVMKDLVMEDLAIGGGKSIGRGVLTGHELSINDNMANLFTWFSDNNKQPLVFGEKFTVNKINNFINSLKTIRSNVAK